MAWSIWRSSRNRAGREASFEARRRRRRTARLLSTWPRQARSRLPPAKPALGARPIEIVAAEADRVWLKIDGAIRTAAPGDNVAGLGRIGAIVARNGGWVLLDDKGAELLSVAKGANGASLFTRRRIFE